MEATSPEPHWCQGRGETLQPGGESITREGSNLGVGWGTASSRLPRAGRERRGEPRCGLHGGGRG